MARNASKTPTEGQLEILRVLWDRGPSTVRQVNQTLSSTKPTGYTTTLKLMQIMLEKGLLTRDTSCRPQVYAAAVSRDCAQRQMVGDLLERVFDGSASRLVMQVLSSKEATAAEKAEIRRILREYEEGGQ